MKKISKFVFTGLIVVGSVTLTSSARAQMSVDLIMDNFTSSVLSQTTTLLNNSAVESSMRNANSKSRSSLSARKLNLSYTPSKALQQQVVQDMGRKLSARNAAAGAAFNNALGPGKTSYHDLFAQMVNESRLPANNAATALAAYLEIGYMVINNVTDPKSVTPAMDRALQQQTASLLSQNPKITSNANLSRLGEELKLQAVVLYLGWQSAMKTGQIASFRNNIASQFKNTGLDMSLVKLTSQGLRKK